MSRIVHLIYFFSSFIFLPSLFAQSSGYLPLNREKGIVYAKFLNSKDCFIHTGIKPFQYSSPFDSTYQNIEKNKNKIQVVAICNSNYTNEIGNNLNPYRLEGGARTNILLTKQLACNLVCLSGLSNFAPLASNPLNNHLVAQGMGTLFYNKGAYSYQYYAGYVSYSPNRIFNFQLGRDKNFLGDGYRSLFLSDQSNSYPFVKISTTVWKIKYVNLFTLFKDASTSSFKNDFKNKYATFHYLSWNATHRFNLSLFESILWQGTDSNRSRLFDVNYLNPVIFYRPVEYSLGSSDNSFLGIAFKLKVGKKYAHQFYGQLLLDEFLLKEIKAMKGWWGNKQGVQVGYNYFDVAGIKNLQLQTEVNVVRPYTYSHGSVQQNYSHFNQSLAHPLGANFVESISLLNYHSKRWLIEAEYVYAVQGRDYKNIHYGGNIFDPYLTRPYEYGNKIGQGLKTNLSYRKFKIAYTLLPSMDMAVEAGIVQRTESNRLNSLTSTYVFIGIKTRLLNTYNDY
jgi:hypothetical protein